MHIRLGSLTLASEMDEMLYQPVAEHFQTLEDLDLDLDSLNFYTPTGFPAVPSPKIPTACGFFVLHHSWALWSI